MNSSNTMSNTHLYNQFRPPQQYHQLPIPPPGPVVPQGMHMPAVIPHAGPPQGYFPNSGNAGSAMPPSYSPSDNTAPHFMPMHQMNPPSIPAGEECAVVSGPEGTASVAAAPPAAQQAPASASTAPVANLMTKPAATAEERRMESPLLSAETRTLFREGISLVLSRWSCLQLAVENEWGGRSSRAKALKLSSDIFSWFTQIQGVQYADDLEALLDEAMLSLNTEVDDGSIEEVAYELMCMHEECVEGNYETIQRLRTAASQAEPVRHIRQVENSIEEFEDGDDDNMMVDAPETNTNQTPTQAAKNVAKPSNAAEAEDGWEVVSKKKKTGRRKN